MSETDLTVTNQNNKVAVHDEEAEKELIRRLENFTKTLNVAPKAEKIKIHQGKKYIPISSVEKDLQRYFFGLVQFEVKSYQQIFNEFIVHARIKVFNPVLRQWMNYDGMGAGMFQQEADSPIQDFHIFKLKNAGKITVPNAYAAALKNAAKKIGKRFGSDLNRKEEDVAEYEPFLKSQPATTDEKKHQKEVDRINHLIQDSQTMEELENVKPFLMEENFDAYNERAVFLTENEKPHF